MSPIPINKSKQVSQSKLSKDLEYMVSTNKKLAQRVTVNAEQNISIRELINVRNRDQKIPQDDSHQVQKMLSNNQDGSNFLRTKSSKVNVEQISPRLNELKPQM